MGNYTRMMTLGIADEHYEHAALVTRARDLAAELPTEYRDTVERLCDAFIDLRVRYEEEVAECAEQASIVARLADRLETAR